MDRDSLNLLKKRFDFEAWRGTNAPARDIVRQQVLLPHKLLAGLEPGHFRDIDPGDGTRLLRASWSSPGDDDTIIFVDLRECQSLERAREVVLELLGNIQAPDIERTKESIGDVNFGRGELSMLIFARDNLAITVRNGGDNIVPVAKYAQMIDDWILSGEF